MGLLTRGQEQFAGALSRETGLDPRVVGAWALAEQSGGAAHGYERRGYHNWLNIANTSSGPARGSASSSWRNPLSAARATAEWLRGSGPITKEYGRAAPGILSILRAGGNPQAQINAIARSGWASSGYRGGADLRSLFSELGGQKFPTAALGGASSSSAPGASSPSIQQGQPGANPQVVAAIASLLRQQEAPQPVAAAARPPLPPELAAQVALPGGGVHPPPSPQPKPEASLSAKLLPLLEQLGTGSETTLSAGNAPNALTNAVPHGSKLAGFLPGNAPLEVKRRDQGQDVKTAPGGAILAPGSGYVIAVPSDPHGFGVSYPVVHFTSGPLKGRDVYVGHTRSALAVGAHFGAGTVLSHTGHGTGPYVGNATGLPGWAEIGLWGGSGPVGGAGERGGNLIAPLLGLGSR